MEHLKTADLPDAALDAVSGGDLVFEQVDGKWYWRDTVTGALTPVGPVPGWQTGW
jgi:hypothetical protein